MAIKQITDLVFVTDKLQKYSSTHTFVTGKTFKLKKELEALGGKFDTLYSKSVHREKSFKYISKGYWIPNENIDAAQNLLINAE
jgi:hypothetical protein